MTQLRKFSLVFAFLFFVTLTSFHHGWSNYHEDKPIDYEGTIQESVYENPHATAKVKQGNKVWLVVLAPVSRMTARGVTEDMVKKGATIRVVGYQHKKIDDEMRAERIFVDGNKYELR